MQKHCSIQILGIKRLLKATLKGIPLPMRLLTEVSQVNKYQLACL